LIFSLAVPQSISIVAIAVGCQAEAALAECVAIDPERPLHEQVNLTGPKIGEVF
jgi:hypothetical protein